MHSKLRPSPAMVVALIALFTALGSSAAALSGSNTVQSDDLGPGAQVKAPDVANNAVNGADVINNSVTGTDVKDLTGGDVTNDSLTGLDVNEATLGIVPNADQLDGTDSSGFLASGSVQKLNFEDAGSGTMTDLATVGPYTIKGQCIHDVGFNILILGLFVNGPAGTADVMAHNALNDDNHTHSSFQFSNPASTDTDIHSTGVGEGARRRIAGTAMLKTGSDVVQVDFNGVADNPSGTGGENCYLYGTAMMGT